MKEGLNSVQDQVTLMIVEIFKLREENAKLKGKEHKSYEEQKEDYLKNIKESSTEEHFQSVLESFNKAEIEE